MNYYNDNKHNKKLLIFLPGWGFKATIWQTISLCFSNYSTLLIDLPIENINYHYPLDSISNIANRIDEMISEECILISWSLSSIFAAYLCHKNPNKYKKLITVTSSPKFLEENNWYGINKKILSQFYFDAQINMSIAIRKFTFLIAEKNLSASHLNLISSHLLSHQHKHALLFYLNLLQHADAREIYSQLNVPVLHLLGDRDAILPATCATSLQKYFPNHITKIISGAGHIPFLTHQKIFLNDVKQFLNE